jgi:hypothetical protein
MTTPPTKTAYSKAKLEEMAESVGWWHSIDLGHGVVTKGFKGPPTERITCTHPLFKFQLIHVCNQHYDPTGRY